MKSFNTTKFKLFEEIFQKLPQNIKFYQIKIIFSKNNTYFIVFTKFFINIFFNPKYKFSSKNNCFKSAVNTFFATLNPKIFV